MLKHAGNFMNPCNSVDFFLNVSTQKCRMDFASGGFGGVAMQEIVFKTITSTICAPENRFKGDINPWKWPAEKHSGNH